MNEVKERNDITKRIKKDTKSNITIRRPILTIEEQKKRLKRKQIDEEMRYKEREKRNISMKEIAPPHALSLSLSLLRL